MLKPRIILAMPYHLGIIDIISNNLKFHGFDVISFDQMISPKPFKYPHIGHRIYKGYRKIFFNDLSYKNKLRNPDNIKYIQDALTGWDGYTDYTLVIRPDMFTDEVLALLKSRTRCNFVGYQWDGLLRFPMVMDKIKFFDRFFVFDPKDQHMNPNLPLLSTTNFCIDNFPLSSDLKCKNHQLVAYFVGYHIESRQIAIENMVKLLLEQDVAVNFFINGAPKSAYNEFPVNKINNKIKFEDNLINVQKSDILIDFVVNVHNGLSFRVFEALFFQKKLITNNVEIVKYDFYHPDNILVWGGQDISELKNFIATPYNIEVNSVAEKYFFANWIRNVLDMAPYTPIDLSHIQ